MVLVFLGKNAVAPYHLWAAPLLQTATGNAVFAAGSTEITYVHACQPNPVQPPVAVGAKLWVFFRGSLRKGLRA